MPGPALESSSVLSLSSPEINDIMRAQALNSDAHRASEPNPNTYHPMSTSPVSACQKSHLLSQKKHKGLIAVEKRRQKSSAKEKNNVLSCKAAKTHTLTRTNMDTRSTDKPKIAAVQACSPSEDSRRQGSNDENPKGLKDKKSDLYKTEICRNWQEIGCCRYGKKCRYAHGHSELRTVKRHQRYKTEICRTYHETGTCPYGVRCTFIHNEKSLANPNIVFNMGKISSKKPCHHQATTGDNYSTTSSPELSVDSRDTSLDQSTSSSDESTVGSSQPSFGRGSEHSFVFAIENSLPLDNMDRETKLYEYNRMSTTQYPVNELPSVSLDMFLLGTRSKETIAPKLYNYFAQLNNDDPYQLTGKTFLKPNNGAASFSVPMASSSKFSWQVSHFGNTM